jgi:hypothetical protein
MTFNSRLRAGSAQLSKQSDQREGTTRLVEQSIHWEGTTRLRQSIRAQRQVREITESRGQTAQSLGAFENLRAQNSLDTSGRPRKRSNTFPGYYYPKASCIASHRQDSGRRRRIAKPQTNQEAATESLGNPSQRNRETIGKARDHLYTYPRSLPTSKRHDCVYAFPQAPFFELPEAQAAAITEGRDETTIQRPHPNREEQRETKTGKRRGPQHHE